MAWVHDDPDEDLYHHEGWAVAVDAAGVDLPPIEVPLTYGEGTAPNDAWWLYDGREGRPLAAAVRAGCECGWRSDGTFPIDFDDHEATDGAEYGEGPWAAWAGHIRDLVRVTMPTELSEALTTVRRQVVELTSSRPLVALEAVAKLELFLDAHAPKVGAAAREQGATWDAIGRTLGTTRQAAFQRFGKHTTTIGEDAA